MRKLSRRRFLQSAAGTAAALSLPFTARSYAQIVGSNEAVRMGVVGFHGRGGSHISGIKKEQGFRMAALCDVDTKVLEVHAHQFPGIATDVDMRKMYDRKDVDAVSIATPNHWHALAAIWAIQAGKDVYVEKPVSHNVSEGRRIVEFARKHGKMVQAGTQSRSSREGIAKAVEYVQSGKLGKIKLARGLCYKRRPSIGKSTVPLKIPDGIDFDLWCGPAEKLPIMRKALHYDWHWVWNTGNGDLGNQGIHEMDVARWFLGEKELSPTILTVGGRLGYIDDGETPNTLVAYHGYAAAPLIFEVRGLASKVYPQGVKEQMDSYKGAAVGIVIECEGGHVTVPSYGKGVIYDNDGKQITKFEDNNKNADGSKYDGTDAHFSNFLKAVRSRQHEDLYADIEDGHLSSALCHTANISHRLGKQTDPEAIDAAMKSNAAFAEAYDRMKEHLANNKVDISKEKLTLGAPLTMNPKAENFPGNDAANALLTRPYRAPYVVPDKVS
jgi:predicted dehydrogenase